MGILSGLGSLHAAAIDEEKTVPQEAINEIQAVTSTVPVRVLRGTGGQLRFHLYGKSMEEIGLVCEIDAGKAVVGLQSKHKRALWGLLHLDIYIPVEYTKGLSIQATSGAVKRESVDLASLTVQTTSGHIAIENIEGNAALKAKSGSVLACCMELENQSLDVETSSGSITVKLPASAEFLLDARSSSGSIDSDFTVSATGASGEKKLQGRVGKKSNSVSLRTSSGSISMKKL